MALRGKSGLEKRAFRRLKGSNMIGFFSNLINKIKILFHCLCGCAVFSLVCFLYFRIFIDFAQKTKKVDMDEVKMVQVINLEKAKERRENYEKMLDLKFGGKLFAANSKDITMKATHGRFDLIFEELDDENNVVKTFDASEIDEKKVELKKKVRYKVYDRNYPNEFFYYKFNPSGIIYKKKHMSLGEFGCVSSHLRAIYNLANSGDDVKYGAIFEDDFLLVDDFNKKLKKFMKKVPEDFGILKLDGVHNGRSGRWNSWLRSRFRYGRNAYWYNANVEGRKVGLATAYIMTKDYAKKIVKWLKTNDLNGTDATSDVLLFMVLPRKYDFDKIYIAKQVLVSQNSSFMQKGSNIKAIEKGKM